MRARRLLPRHPDLRLQRAVLGPLLRRLHAVHELLVLRIAL